ncbi:pyridoxamine 5'-phosphate oxidase family protein [Pseudoxanthobacter sp. M-2]|uniref:pyridoxamine 5'-phosphate oxidase family protein n=1 Tax=Pseudoxanthobacter sp. M-2 TaxID=3078754 RepID=UPI0038FC37BB
MAKIADKAALRRLYAEPVHEVLVKELPLLDVHCRALLAESRFYVIATQGADGLGDVTPRGDRTGQIQVLDDRTIALPDWPGNNRLDTLTNILDNPAVGLLFVVPGLSETLRVNGTAELRDDAELKALFETNGRLPLSVVVVTVRQAYIQCGKAFLRSQLWKPETWVDRSVLPPMGVIFRDHCQLGEVLSEQAIADDYKATLY